MPWSRTSTGGGAAREECDPVICVRLWPQALRQLVQVNPQILQPMLQELGKQNPQLLQQINNNQVRPRGHCLFSHCNDAQAQRSPFGDLRACRGFGGTASLRCWASAVQHPFRAKSQDANRFRGHEWKIFNRLIELTVE